jgi:hypothetical protein
MQIIVEVIAGWISLSCLFGLLFAWGFFYPEQRAAAIQAAHDHWISTHPTSPLELMPRWLRWEDTALSGREAAPTVVRLTRVSIDADDWSITGESK